MFGDMPRGGIGDFLSRTESSIATSSRDDRHAIKLIFAFAFGWAVLTAAMMGDHANSKFASASNAVYGINNTARMLGGLLSPLFTGLLLDRTGTLSTGFFVAGAVLAIAAALAPLVAEQSERQMAQSAS